VYLLLGFGLVISLVSTVRDVMLASGWLQPELVTDYVRKRMHLENDTLSFEEWQEEDDLSEYSYLRRVSLVCPFFMVATYLVCAYHTIQHMKKLNWTTSKRGDPLTEHTFDNHDRALRIIALPLFYGVMSFQGVMRMWGISINSSGDSHHFSQFTLRKRFLMDSYDACFWLADMYESYALFVFGLIVLEYLRQRLNTRIYVAHDAIKTNTIPRASDSFSELTDSVKVLLSQTKGLTILGIKLFCATCAGQAFYGVVVNCAAYYHIMESVFGTGCHTEEPGMLQTEKVKNMVHYLFYGAGFIASFAAIGNLVEVERGFHSHLREFSPIWKFLGTKIIVTIAFLQSMALASCPPFCWWSYTRANLLYASLLCIECFLISVVHLYAWSAEESWYEVYTPLIDLTETPSPERSPSPRLRT
ncbi:unnamed protein product, partial [Effrenium voratum]